MDECLTPSQDLDENRGVWTNKIVTREVTSLHEGAKPCYGATFALKSHAKEVFSTAQVRDMFELDFQERCKGKNEQSLSVEDQRFLKILDEGVHKREDGHYEMPLPLRSEEIRFPNNRSLALRRLFHLKARFQRDSSYYRDYLKFMERVIDDCAERCPENVKEDSNRMGKINYVPHHGVYHPKKPGKIRVVFYCSAQYAGTSLNQNLLQGPDLTNSLVGVLCSFREEAVAFSCDV